MLHTGSCLFKKSNGPFHPVSLFMHKLTQTYSTYATLTIERVVEALRGVNAVQLRPAHIVFDPICLLAGYFKNDLINLNRNLCRKKLKTVKR